MHLTKNSLVPEILVPIKIDFEVQDFRVQDSFSWNINETLITPEIFAEIMCTDLELPIGPGLANEFISESIHEQISNHLETIDLLESKSHFSLPHESEDSDFELRVPINIEIISGQMVLRDQIEWDLSLNPLDYQTTKFINEYKKNKLDSDSESSFYLNYSNFMKNLEFTKTPECFSKNLCSDLGIGGEFIPLVSNCIREQIFRFQKERLNMILKYETKAKSNSLKAPKNEFSAQASSNTDFSDVESDKDSEGSNQLGKWYGKELFKQNSITNVYRNESDVDDWGPSLEALSSEEIDRVLLAQERSR
ncbi:SWI/SNF-related matrix-associated actin-dependent regulator of chromatin subfamily B member 1, partial [Smittium mucronatum]